jgi:processive 1,2-diacylglycerol beta-glucosyltransferase
VGEVKVKGIDVRRVLVLTSDTGAGHRSVSNALIEEARLRPGAGIELIDIDPYLPLPALPVSDAPAEPPTPFDRLAPLYNPMIVKAPWLWGAIWYGTNNGLALGAYLRTLGEIVVRRIARAAERIEAEAIVSVHPLAIHAMVRARSKLGQPNLPLMAVVTDLVDVHRWWADPEVDQYVVGSDVAGAALERLGVHHSRIAPLGIPIRRTFREAVLTAREARERVALDTELPLVLVTGGGAGAGRIPETGQAIARVADQGAPPFQLAALAGRNERALAALRRETWPVPTMTGGVVPNIAEMMTAADVLVTKPGSLTVSEALVMGRPLVLGKPLPGQEEGNIGYIVKAGAGLHYRSPGEAAEAVAYLLKDPEARWEMGRSAMRLAKPRATERTLDTLQGMLLRAAPRAYALAS